MTDDLAVVLTTCGSEEEANRIARALVGEKLVACVNRFPVRSCYSWEGAVHDEAEILLIMKTLASVLSALRQRLFELHSYDVPEFVVLDVTEVSDAYAAWVGRSVRSTEGSGRPRPL